MLPFLPRAIATAALVSVGVAGTVGANDTLGEEPATDPTSGLATPVLPFVVSAPPLVISVEGPLEIPAPPLVLAVEGPLEIDAPTLVLAVEGPLEIDSPPLVLVVEGPLVIDAPALPLVVETDDEDKDHDDEIANDSVTPTPFAGGGASPTPFPGQNASPSRLAGSEPTSDRVAPRLCVGKYTVHMKQAVGKSTSHVMPVGTREVASATLSTESCGAFLTLESQGQKILLARQHGDKNVYQGELHVPDGAKRVMTLTCGQNLTMFGGIVARDDRARVSRQMWLQLDRVNEAVLAACAEAK